MNRKSLKLLLAMLAVFTMLLFVAACDNNGSSGSSEVKGDTTDTGGNGLTAGAYADVHVEMLADGTLYAASIELGGEGDDENEGDEEGEDQEGDHQDDDQGEDQEGDHQDDDQGEDQEGDHQDDDQDDDDDDDEGDDDDDEGDKEKFEAQVDSVAADFSSFVVFGDLVVMMETDDGDQAQDAENDSENDEADDLEIPALTVGLWIEAKGAFDPVAGIFYAEEIKARTDGETDAGIESLIDTVGDGSFTMLGLTITFDANTEISGGEENDGVDCQQEGENEGENTNC